MFWGDLQGSGPFLLRLEGEAQDLLLLQCRVVAFQGMKVFFMVVAAVYVLYLLFLVVRACSELRHMPYVGERHLTSVQCEVVREEWLEATKRVTWRVPGSQMAEWVTLGHGDGASASAGGGLWAGRELGPEIAWVGAAWILSAGTLQRAWLRRFLSP